MIRQLYGAVILVIALFISACPLSSAPLGLPIPFLFGSEGAYISDDKKGRVFRVIYTGK